MLYKGGCCQRVFNPLMSELVRGVEQSEVLQQYMGGSFWLFFNNSEKLNTICELQFGPKLSKTQVQKFKSIASRFPSLFGKDTPGKMKTRHYIRTDGVSPIRAGIPRLSQEEIRIIKAEVETMLENDVIEPLSQIRDQLQYLIQNLIILYVSVLITNL